MKKGKGKRIQKFIKYLLILGSLAGILFWCNRNVLSVAAKEDKIIVGFIGENDFVDEEAKNYHGYAVEYLEAIAGITGWEYEFVYGTWESCMAQTISG